MKKKIAMPTKNNKLFAQFNQCSQFVIFTIDDNNNKRQDLFHTDLQPGLIPYWLAKKGVTDVIVNCIDTNAINKLNQFKIDVFVGVNSFDPELLVEEFLDGTLETNGALVGN